MLARAAVVVTVIGCSGTQKLPVALVDVPPDLAARSAELLALDCPPGTKIREHRDQTSGVLSLSRQCRGKSGAEGPGFTLTRTEHWSTLVRGGVRSGVRQGKVLRLDDVFVTEYELANNHPVGVFRRRQRSTGIVLIEGRFDGEGRLDGEWIFNEPDTGRTLGKSTLANGTGTFELWEAGTTAGQPDYLLSRVACVAGVWEGPAVHREALLPYLSERDREATTHYSAGLPHGRWQLARIADGKILEDGNYDRGVPVGTWHMVDENACLAQKLHDETACPADARDVRYRCERDNCSAGTPSLTNAALAAPAKRTTIQKCTLPAALVW